MLEIIATSYAMVFGVRLPSEDVASREMMTVQNHVENRLHDPDFKPNAIADELAMAQRDVRQLFVARGECARAYVSRRRLEEAARRLLPGFEKTYPGATAALSGKYSRFHWPTHPFTKAAYSCFKSGQWTTIAGAEQRSVGNLHFAGEHCS